MNSSEVSPSEPDSPLTQDAVEWVAWAEASGLPVGEDDLQDELQWALQGEGTG